MTTADADDEITIEDAIRISGKSRRTLMRLKRAGRLQAHISDEVVPQSNRVLKFRRSEIEALASKEV